MEEQHPQKTAAEVSWREPWNPTEPIENMFLKLEELFVQAIITGLAYTYSQLIDKALDCVKPTGLYVSASQDWNALSQ